MLHYQPFKITLSNFMKPTRLLIKNNAQKKNLKQDLKLKIQLMNTAQGKKTNRQNVTTTPGDPLEIYSLN